MPNQLLAAAWCGFVAKRECDASAAQESNRRVALERWAEFIGACADGREAEIIPIRPPLSAAA